MVSALYSTTTAIWIAPEWSKWPTNARKMFEGLPGLRFKVLTVDVKQQRAINFYVWDSPEAAEGLFTDELRETTVTGLCGTSPTVNYLEIAELVDNS